MSTSPLRRTAALGCVLLSLALAAPAGAAQWRGFSENSSAATAAALAARAGANTVRYTISWSWLEPTKGSYAWSNSDGMYWNYVSRGIRPLIVILGAPDWAQAPASDVCARCHYPPSPAHDADWASIVGKIAQRYPRAAGIEVWNEPNLTWAWGSGPDPARYTQLLKLAYEAVKAVNPDMPVLGGSLPPVFNESTTGDWGLRPFLTGMYKAGARGFMDGLALHPYPQDIDFWRTYAAMAFAKEAMISAGDDVPLWLTEFGVTTTGPDAFTEAQQSITLDALYRALNRQRGVAGLYIHSLIDSPSTPNPSARGWGLLHDDLSPKPAYCRIANANGGDYQCPATVARPTPTANQVKHWEAQELLNAALVAAQEVHRDRGTFAGLTVADLNAKDPRISAVPVTHNMRPGPNADPRRIGVFHSFDGSDAIALCNVSRAVRSYCVYELWGGRMTFGSLAGDMLTTARATWKNSISGW